MQQYEKTFLELAIMGAFIGIAKLMVSSEEMTFRVIFGRAVLGSAASTAAGAVLLQFPDISPMAVMGLGSLTGILGAQYMEKYLRKKLKDVDWSKKNGKL